MALDDGRRRGLLTLAGVAECAAELAARGRSGPLVIRELLAERAEAPRGDSPLEDQLLEIIRRADRARYNRLELLGWRLLRYTAYDVRRRDTDIVTEIDAGLSVARRAS
ncbi:MAG: hypothetical protein JJE52_18540 [Acidimicrobiia bacterium]|nr:hypothetical protein [Acidimicrobiia bacterium]